MNDFNARARPQPSERNERCGRAHDEQFEALLDQAGGGKGLEPVLAAVKRDLRLATRANRSGKRLLRRVCVRGSLELA